MDFEKIKKNQEIHDEEIGFDASTEEIVRSSDVTKGEYMNEAEYQRKKREEAIEMRERVDRFLGPEGSEDRLDEVHEIANEEKAYRKLLKRAGAENDPEFKLPDDYSTALLRSKESGLDPLTGMNNRDFIKKNIKAILSKEKRAKEKKEYNGFSILFIDIDNFKEINDTLGHDTGDEVLKAVAKIINKEGVIRGSDIACRWGGDEFIILLPDCDSLGTEIVINRIREELKKIRTSNLEEEITLSIGFANSKEILKLGWNEIRRRADVAMYYAKKELGKNRSADYDDLPDSFKNLKIKK
jgi:diguanylate cyclase (GGDEF)-like protein